MPKRTETHEIEYDPDELRAIIAKHLRGEGYIVPVNEIELLVSLTPGGTWPSDFQPNPRFDGVLVKRAVKFVL